MTWTICPRASANSQNFVVWSFMLHALLNLQNLPVWFGELTTLQVLKLSDLDNLAKLSPSIFATLPNLTSLTIYLPFFDDEIPSSIFDNLTALKSLTLKSFKLGKDEKARERRGLLKLAPLTSLRTLDTSGCRLLALSPPPRLYTLKIRNCSKIVKDLPDFIGAMHEFRTLSLDGRGHRDGPGPGVCRRERKCYKRAWLALASALPSLVSLESLYLNQHDVGRPCNDTLLTIALALKAWPKPCLALRFFERQTMFGAFKKELGLPADAWWSIDPPLMGYGDPPADAEVLPYPPTDAAVLRFFEAQQENVTAFVCGQVCYRWQISLLFCEVSIGSRLSFDT
jgi:hypothetical protein